MSSLASVVLTQQEKALALKEAHRRQSLNEQRSLRGRNGAPAFGSKALEAHVLGSTGEMAVASFLGLKNWLYSETMAVRGSCDLPGMIDVKTRKGHNRDLIVQKDENPRKKLVLVTIEEDIIIRGWCLSQDAMQPRYWADPAKGRPAYFVPQRELRDIFSLVVNETV